MRDVVVIGGGLSGLAAAYQLEKRRVAYTLIEVRRELGGSIRSLRQHGFVLDAGPFVLADTLPADWLAELGLQDALYPFSAGTAAFRDGSAALVNALSQRIQAPRMMRMAVSSIGELEDGRFGICMENGLMLDAKALIIALPARYAQRVFYGYRTDLTEKLFSYRYDTVQRVSLGFRSADLPAQLTQPEDMAYVFCQRTDHPARVPAGCSLLQFGLRIAPQPGQTASALVDLLCRQFGLPQPITQAVGYWSEADPISRYDDIHTDWVNDLRANLPAGIALIGSDYSTHDPVTDGVARLDERMQQGIDAVERLLS
jgi:protoporphyrinogen oxidase